MPKDISRPSLPTSSSDFALPPISSPGASGSSVTLDDPNYLLQRFRRPSLLSSRIHSPLSSSFTLHHARRRSQSQAAFIAEESESEKERMSTDSPSSSENATPPLKGSENGDDEPVTAKPKPSKPPLTPPRRRSSAASMDSDMPTIFNRRLAFPLKPPRILKILSEPKPEEDEVKSEAAFQRLLHSNSELPIPPRTPRPFTDRGRYPEEAPVHEEETQREETPSDDELELDEPFAFSAPPPPATGTQPINIVRQKTQTPAGSAAGSVNGDDASMLMSVSETSSSSFGGNNMMDVDMVPGSPLLPSISSTSWRYTPPPTSSAVRSNKRKLEDRFDPYPTSSKRRAVSPSLHYLRDPMMASMSSPMGRGNNGNPRAYPISIPITIPSSTASSAASSPTIASSSYTQYPRLASNTSSPTMRSAPMLLASPILRPIPRRRQEGEEREVAGAGEAVNGLTLTE
ncbi:hypothetical protein CC1G_01787 [Coprinopsis cinerea okayama7|uniref:Uncharacterized protein n=1 Tax=Coprinopsis cinerea (strain Okayama-7 / 130 / ATCC MYA-4618 / FGSC 9003) TaxID=240176 RepID=A8N2N9_COPC7|nr:hypothetical protein CC1G_01787 [Coprinopsis cinerea okayama7\|eukprot:XP_001829107.2 hypothetical protein CC1G_01787 [Coprinopsis cinerea okayama7\